MNQAVYLLNQWAEYESGHPEGEIADFCRFYLAKQRQKQIQGQLTGGIVPQAIDGLLLKMIGRINKLNTGYAGSALEGTGLNQVEELGILLTLQQLQNPKKTEIIYNNLFKLSSGTNLIGRLINRGLIKEQDDEDDRRSKRIALTPTGRDTIEFAKRRMGMVSKMMVNDLTEDDKKLCIALLKNIEVKYASLWLAHKGKSFDQVFEEVMGSEK